MQHKAPAAHLQLPGTSVTRCMKLADLGSWGGRPVTDAASTGSSLIWEVACNPGELLLLDTAASIGLAGSDSCREAASLWRPHLEASGGLPPRMAPRSVDLGQEANHVSPCSVGMLQASAQADVPPSDMLAAHSSSTAGGQSGMPGWPPGCHTCCPASRR